MKISNSAIYMEGERQYSSSSYFETMTLETRDGEGLMNRISEVSQETGKNLVESMKQQVKEEKENNEKQQKQNMMKSMLDYMNRMRNCKNEEMRIPDETSLQIKLLRKLLAALSGKKLDPLELEEMKNTDILDLRSTNFKKMDMVSQIHGGNGESAASPAPIRIGTDMAGTVWHKITATSGFHSEAENTAFRSTGIVSTEDGRSISFGVEVNLSRSFTEKVDIFKDVAYIKTDPLIINLDTDAATLSDVKFRFDLDSDGRKEEISFAGKGSGFLALDKNGNGIIDDGSELFGTASGDGFADLAAYDGDGNMWIDENDEIYSRLRVWVRDDEGNDRLIDLKTADVGAIYLGNSDTEFSLKNESNTTNGIIQKTGVYLKESGGAGTLNHVDLVM